MMLAFVDRLNCSVPPLNVRPVVPEILPMVVAGAHCERAAVEIGLAGVGVVAGEDLGARTGLGEIHARRAVGNDAAVGEACCRDGPRVEREIGHAAVAAAEMHVARLPVVPLRPPKIGVVTPLRIETAAARGVESIELEPGGGGDGDGGAGPDGNRARAADVGREIRAAGDGTGLVHEKNRRC